MGFARRRGWEERRLASPAAPELEGGSSICYAAGDDVEYTVATALAQLRVHTVPKSCCDYGAVMLLWYPGTYSAFGMLCSATKGQS